MTHLFIFNNASRAANYGVGTYVRQLAEGFRGRPDWEVSFVDLFSDVEEYTIGEDEHGCRHYRVPAASSNMESETYCRCAFYFLARHIPCDEGGRMVFLFNYFHHFPLATLLKGRYFDARVVFVVHFLNWCFRLKGNLSRFRQLTTPGYQPQDDEERQVLADVETEKRALRLADEVIVLAGATRRFLAEDYGISADKLHLVYNGWGDGPCPVPDSRPGAPRVVLFVGRLDEIKGPGYLIGAFRQVAGKHSDVRLVVAGDGDFQCALSQCRDLQGRVSFLGKVASEELEPVYASPYIRVIPSFHAQCRYTAIEIMRHGIPLVGTDSTGLAEMLDATPELRVHIDEDDLKDDDFTAQMAACMDLLLSDDDARRRASQAVTELYEARYKAADMIRGTEAVVEVSFRRPGYTLSPDFLKPLDYRMMQLVNQSPDIDLDFYGMGGIGVYLWKRATDLWDDAEEAPHTSLLWEYLIYYMDWLQEAAGSECLPDEVLAMLHDMKRRHFYPLAAEALLARRAGGDVPRRLPSDRDIMQNTLKICNCKI